VDSTASDISSVSFSPQSQAQTNLVGFTGIACDCSDGKALLKGVWRAARGKGAGNGETAVRVVGPAAQPELLTKKLGWRPPRAAGQNKRRAAQGKRAINRGMQGMQEGD
jgi:hypothetical protein